MTTYEARTEALSISASNLDAESAALAENFGDGNDADYRRAKKAIEWVADRLRREAEKRQKRQAR